MAALLLVFIMINLLLIFAVLFDRYDRKKRGGQH